jgi:hypothetical protein
MVCSGFQAFANDMPKNIFSSFQVDTTDGYTSSKKIKLENRTYTSIMTGMNLSFLVGSDAKLVKEGLRATLGSAEIYPRIGYYIRSVSNIRVGAGFEIVLGIGYDMKGWFERHQTARVASIDPIPRVSALSNDAYVRTDYLSLYLGGMYKVTDWMGIRTGLDLGVLLYAYYRTGKFIRDFDILYWAMDRRAFKPVVPSFDFGLVLGKSDGVKFGLDLQYSGDVVKNLNYNYMLLKFGINYGFNMVPQQQNYY